MTNTRKALERAGLVSRAFGVVSPLGSTLLLLLAPKCPLCVTAYLASVGLSAGAALYLAPLLRPALVVFAALGVLAFLWRATQHMRRAPACCCQSFERNLESGQQ